MAVGTGVGVGGEALGLGLIDGDGELGGGVVGVTVGISVGAGDHVGCGPGEAKVWQLSGPAKTEVAVGWSGISVAAERLEA